MGIRIYGPTALLLALWGNGAFDEALAREPVEDVGNPCGRATRIRWKCGTLGRRKIPTEFGNNGVIDTTFSDPPQGEDDQGALRVFCRNEARGDVAEDDFGFAAADAATRAGGAIPASHGHLVGEAKGVGGVRAAWKHLAASLALDEILHGLVAWTQCSKHRIMPGHVIEAAACTADETGFAVAGKSLVHGGARA